jgi:hypothetical protein
MLEVLHCCVFGNPVLSAARVVRVLYCDCTIRYCPVLSCTVLYCTVLYYDMSSELWFDSLWYSQYILTLLYLYIKITSYHMVYTIVLFNILIQIILYTITGQRVQCFCIYKSTIQSPFLSRCKGDHILRCSSLKVRYDTVKNTLQSHVHSIIYTVVVVYGKNQYSTVQYHIVLYYMYPY